MKVYLKPLKYSLPPLHLFAAVLALMIFSFSPYIIAQDKEEEPELELEAPIEISDINIKFVDVSSDSAPFEEETILGILTSQPGEILIKSTIGNDILAIKRYYFDNGFFSASVDTSIKYDYGDEEAEVTFKIKQNERSYLNEIEFTGLEDINDRANNAIFVTGKTTLISGEPYSKNKLNIEVARILTALFNNGYAFAKKQEIKVTEIISNDPSKKNKVNLELEFETGNVYTFGTTDVNIRDKKYNFSDQDILRELQYKEGEIYDNNKLTASERKISSIPLIESSVLDIDNVDSTNNVINYKVEVNLRNKYELTPEVLGYDIGNRFYGGVGLSFTNRYFFNSARTFSSSVRGLINSLKYNRIESLVQVSESYLFNNPEISGNLRAGVNLLTEDTADIIETRGKVGISYNLPSYTYINGLLFDLEIINQHLDLSFNFTDTTGASQQATINANVLTSYIGGTVIHTGIDDPVFPTKGFNQTFGVQEGGLLALFFENVLNLNNFKYLKLTSLNKFFLNLSNKPKSTSVLAQKFFIGFLFEYGNNQGFIDVNEETFNVLFDLPAAPVDARFTAGGTNNNRGWKADHLGFVPDQDEGGNFSIDGSIEHRLRPFLSSSNDLIKDLGFVYFWDYGNVWENLGDFRLDQIAMSIGAGIRYYTIIGAVRVDVGFKLYDPNPGPVGVTKWLFESGANWTDKYNIQFGIGNTF